MSWWDIWDTPYIWLKWIKLAASIRNSQINSKNAMKSVNFNLLVNSAPALADSLPSVSSPPTPVTAVTTPVTRHLSEGNHLYSLCSQFWLKESHPVRRNTSSSQNSAETWNWSQVRLRHLLPNFHSSLNAWLLVFHLQRSNQQHYIPYILFHLSQRLVFLMNYRAVCFRDNLRTFSKSQGSYL